MLSGTWKWIKENKWKSAAAAAVVGGYLWYKQAQQNRAEVKLEKQRMNSYWRDSQIAADSTIAKFVPILTRKVEAHTRLSEIISSLRNPANDKQAKTVLFEELKVAAFSSHMLFTFALVFIAHYMRVSVNVVGRHLFASVNASEGASSIDMVRNLLPRIWFVPALNGSEPEPGRKVDESDLLQISPSVRDRCLGSTEFFMDTGLPILADVVSQACIGTLANHKLDDSLTLDQLVDIFMHIRTVVEGQFPKQYEGRPATLLQTLMMPPESTLPYSFETPEDAVYATGLEPEDKVRMLMNESRNVMESHAFLSLLQHSFNVSFASLAETIATSFPKPPAPAPVENTEEVRDALFSVPSFPLAKLLPALSNHFKTLSAAKENEMVSKVTGTTEFNEFSYRIFHGPE